MDARHAPVQGEERHGASCATAFLGLPLLLLLAIPFLTGWPGRGDQVAKEGKTSGHAGSFRARIQAPGALRQAQEVEAGVARRAAAPKVWLNPPREDNASAAIESAANGSAAREHQPPVRPNPPKEAHALAAIEPAANGSSAREHQPPVASSEQQHHGHHHHDGSHRQRYPSQVLPLLIDRKDVVRQSTAHFPAGSDLRIYAIGSSSLLWMTWLDQLHLLLLTLGFHVPLAPAAYKPRFYPKTVPACDDSMHFEYLKTARFARIGWSSWDFAYEGWEGCEDGFRLVNGHKMKCQHGPGCHYSDVPLKKSVLAQDAAKSDITLLATWFNDFEQRWSKYACFNNESLQTEEIAKMSATHLLSNIREIHKKNPKVWVLVLAKYSQTWGHLTEPWLRAANAHVKQIVEREPRTLFVDYEMPGDSVVKLYQTAHAGHLNCQGSRFVARAVVKRLFDEKVLAHGLPLDNITESILPESNCSKMNAGSCHASSVCWVDPDTQKCVEYSGGSSSFHTVCEGVVCEGMQGALEEE